MSLQIIQQMNEKGNCRKNYCVIKFFMFFYVRMIVIVFLESVYRKFTKHYFDVFFSFFLILSCQFHIFYKRDNYIKYNIIFLFHTSLTLCVVLSILALSLLVGILTTLQAFCAGVERQVYLRVASQLYLLRHHAGDWHVYLFTFPSQHTHKHLKFFCQFVVIVQLAKRVHYRATLFEAGYLKCANLKIISKIWNSRLL